MPSKFVFANKIRRGDIELPNESGESDIDSTTTPHGNEYWRGPIRPHRKADESDSEWHTRLTRELVRSGLIVPMGDMLGPMKDARATSKAIQGRNKK